MNVQTFYLDDDANATQVLLGLLGLGAMRSVEKVKVPKGIGDPNPEMVRHADASRSLSIAHPIRAAQGHGDELCFVDFDGKRWKR